MTIQRDIGIPFKNIDGVYYFDPDFAIEQFDADFDHFDPINAPGTLRVNYTMWFEPATNTEKEPDSNAV